MLDNLLLCIPYPAQNLPAIAHCPQNSGQTPQQETKAPLKPTPDIFSCLVSLVLSHLYRIQTRHVPFQLPKLRMRLCSWCLLGMILPILFLLPDF